MPLILAIEPDKRQSSQLASLVKVQLHAELVQGANAVDGLAALHGRVPDLILTSSLMSPRDDAALAAHLRELGAAAAHVQSVTIPLLGSAAPARARGGMLAALRREKPQAMTDGCAPEVFADQICQYLATAEEQKIAAATRVAAEPVAVIEPIAFNAPEPFFEATEPVETAAPMDAMPVDAAPIYDAPVYDAPVDAAPFADAAVEERPLAEVEAAPVEVEPFEPLDVVAAAPAIEPVDVAVETAAAEPDDLILDEPAGLPLSQLLQLVTETAIVEAEAAAVEAAAAAIEAEAALVVEAAPVEAAPVVEAAMAVEAVEPIVELSPAIEVESAPVLEAEPVVDAVSEFGELYVDPMAAQALDELSRQAAPASLADGIPSEVPVPVVEMHSFQSLDSIASELAAGPAQRHDRLDDIASLFAAAPAPKAAHDAPAEPALDFTAPLHGEKSLFSSLFAEPAPSRAPRPVEVPAIDPSLFAAAPVTTSSVVEAAAPIAPSTFELEAAPEPIFVQPVQAIEPEMVAPVPEQVAEEPVMAFEPVVFEPVYEEPAAMAAASAFDEEIALDVDSFEAALAEPEPAIAAAPAGEPSPFSFTIVDGFGDTWSDFEVQNIAAVASDLGVGEHAPSDPYAVASSARAAAAAVARRESASTLEAAPALDDEALSLIGDAARKVSLDAFVIEEFERGIPERRVKKLKKKVQHAGATQVPPPAAERPAKPTKRPVQDEWGMFDPEQCGFAALEDEEAAENHPTAGTRVRVISY